jgi:hypothetical protein
MANTYTLIDKTILTGTQANVEFTGLGSYSSDYTDLQLVMSIRTAASGSYDYGLITFNNNTSNYSTRLIYGDGSSAASFNWGSSAQSSTGMINNSSQTSNTFSSVQVYIPNYSSSNNKSFSIDTVQENNGTAFMAMAAGLWSNTSAITSIKIAGESGSWVSGSSFYLYGIKNS